MREQIGKGYPDGLKGDEIEDVVKIVTVADSFDAITSKRVYRNERTIEEGLEELKKNKEIEETYIESIETLRKIVEAKDNYTLRTF